MAATVEEHALIIISVYMSGGKVAPFLVIQLANYTYQQCIGEVKKNYDSILFIKLYWFKVTLSK